MHVQGDNQTDKISIKHVLSLCSDNKVDSNKNKLNVQIFTYYSFIIFAELLSFWIFNLFETTWLKQL